MGNRLSSIMTRTGDDGTTGLGNGERVPKDAARIEACGSVDELNCALGVLLACARLAAPLRECLAIIQQDLFDLGGELAVPGLQILSERQVARLEAQLLHFNAPLPALANFVVPGGSVAAAAAHMARAICRRAERRCWTLAHLEQLNPPALRYLNRLSDLLFVIARHLARLTQHEEPLWRQPGAPSVDQLP